VTLIGSIDTVNEKPERDRAVFWSRVALILAVLAFVAAGVNFIVN